MLVLFGSGEIRFNWDKPQAHRCVPFLFPSHYHFGRPQIDLFQALGQWCFGCFNLRRDGQCDLNVDPVLWPSLHSSFNSISRRSSLPRPELQSYHHIPSRQPSDPRM